MYARIAIFGHEGEQGYYSDACASPPVAQSPVEAIEQFRLFFRCPEINRIEDSERLERGFTRTVATIRRVRFMVVDTGAPLLSRIDHDYTLSTFLFMEE